IHSEARAILETERDRLIHQLGELGATETGELRNDVDYGEGFADAASATAERTETMGLADNLHEMLVDVNRAIARIDEGTYGNCAKCGSAIPAARLEFRPSSIYCVSCKSAA
ncbi:MAG: TraR/DksA C4-type zinc finger protein, partial [Acidimicrobiia bacterium]|nr:TraR/DksA C4-type zinc finger protein [Acidimicrobiia bacterium]